MATPKKITQPKPAAKGEDIPFDKVSDNRLTVYQANGEKFSSFADHNKMIQWLIKAVNATNDEDTLSLLVDQNEETIGKVDVALANQFHTAVNVRYQQLGNGKPPHDPVTGELLRPGETEIPAQPASMTEGEVRAMNDQARGYTLTPTQEKAVADVAKGSANMNLPAGAGKAAVIVEGDKATGAQPDTDAAALAEERGIEKKPEPKFEPRDTGEAQIDLEDDASTETPERRFMRLAEKRGSRILKDIHLMKNLANRSSYAYTGEQVDHILAMFRAEIDELERKFKASDNKPKQLRLI